MRVRGAPAIAMVGILSLAVEISGPLPAAISTEDDAARLIAEKLDYIATSRPTAVNLRNMCTDLKAVATTAANQPTSTHGPSNPSIVFNAYLHAAAQTLETDLQANKALGDHGAQWLLTHSPLQTNGNQHRKLNILTHCNTGALATSGHGTALGIIRALHTSNHLLHAYFTETRPYNQGARLTGYELLTDSIPCTLITDSMAAFLMHRKRLKGDPIAAAVVGADRVAANGDTANKIGTYALAIAAREHGVGFVVGAPTSSVDLGTKTGGEIEIEERGAGEMTTVAGPVVGADGEIVKDDRAERVSIAAEGVGVWNPAFDVTPARLIDAIVTEKGVVERAEDGVFDMAGVCKA